MTVGQLLFLIVLVFFCCTKPTEQYRPDWENIFQDEVTAKNIEDNVRKISKRPHIAGSAEDRILAEWIRSKWEENGFDQVQIVPYKAFLTHSTQPSEVSVLEKTGGGTYRVVYNFKVVDTPKRKQEEQYYIEPPSNAFSVNGSATGTLIYANYGSKSDLDFLENLGLSLSGSILLIRLGGIFRGAKVHMAQERGAAGVILYDDPADKAFHDKVYPDTWWQPADAIPRGTVIMGGEVQTPGYPAKDYAFRQHKSDSLIRIPSIVISATKAELLLRMMDNETAPTDWQGGFKFTYKLGIKEGSKRSVMITSFIKSSLEEIYNVIATIKGSTEPDRLVILGNHHDAWGFGATDPGSATGCMLEIARSLGVLLNTGWRPKRTILLCSWDAEEYGLIGSNEWVEENALMLSQQAIAYINSDIAVEGNFSLKVKASPLLNEFIYKIARNVEDPENSKKKVYETWKKRSPDSTNSSVPKLKLIGSGSDYAPFLLRLGIPSLDIRYTSEYNLEGKIESYPTYHTLHDTFHWLKTFVDPDFTYHQAVARLLGLAVIRLADSKLLPFNVVPLAKTLEGALNQSDMNSDAIPEDSKKIRDVLSRKIKNFVRTAEEFQANLSTFNSKGDLSLRIMNDKLMQVERSFVVPEGLPRRMFQRNILFSPSEFNDYSPSVFSVIQDEIYRAARWTKLWLPVEEYLAKAVFYVESATRLLGTYYN